MHAADGEDIDIAVRAARKAFTGTWRDMDTSHRGDLLNKLAALIKEHAKVLAIIDTWDSGTYAHPPAPGSPKFHHAHIYITIQGIRLTQH